MANKQSFKRWDNTATGSTDVKNATSFDYFDNDQQFVNDAPKVATWTAQQLGYPVVDVEITPEQMYNAFEDAIIEYGAEVNRFNIRENLPHLQGQPLSTDPTGKNIQQTQLGWSIELAKSYGTEVGAGGDQDWEKTSIDLNRGQQKYDLDKLIGDDEENGKEIEIKKIYHHRIPASKRDYYYDGFLGAGGSGAGIGSFNDVLEEFGFNGLGAGYGSEYLLFPLSEELGRTQHVELYDKMRRSNYSFRLINNKLEIFPIPRFDTQLWIEYIITGERSNPINTVKTNFYNFEHYTNNQLATGSLGWISSSVDFSEVEYNGSLSASLAEATASLNDVVEIVARFSSSFNLDLKSLNSITPSNLSRDNGFNTHLSELNTVRRIDTDSDGEYEFYDVSMFVTRVTGSDDTIVPNANLVSGSDRIQVHYNYLDENQTEDVISDYSNVPYDVIPYRNINRPGRQWIKKYTLALVKIIVGQERSKYQSIPVPNDSVSLNGDALKSEGKEEIRELIEKLRDDLEQTTRRSQLERAAEESRNLGDSLKGVPLKIYTG